MVLLILVVILLSQVELSQVRAPFFVYDTAKKPDRGESARLEVATGTVTDACYQRHTHAEFLDFLKLVAKAYPRVRLHVVADNYATHKHPKVKNWLAKNPRVTMHFTPTSGSWMNMVEIFFGIITRQAIRRGTFTSVKDLITAIENFIDGWNTRCTPFIWTKTADQILAKAHRKTTSNTRH